MQYFPTTQRKKANSQNCIPFFGCKSNLLGEVKFSRIPWASKFGMKAFVHVETSVPRELVFSAAGLNTE